MNFPLMKKQLIILLLLIVNNLSYAQSGKWTWMRGTNTPDSTTCLGSYGIQGVADPNNEPPCRYQCAYWTDLNGNFWIFGGSGLISGNRFNDLWKFDPSTNLWTWMNGAQYGNNIYGVSGTMGVPSVNNYPSARGWGANCWTDNNNNLWLYGGFPAGADLWRYSIATNEWTWINGTNLGNEVVNYGIIGVPAMSNSPGQKNEFKSAWTVDNSLWMFGGTSFTNNVYSDMWKYDISTNMWTCMNGGPATVNSPGVYGTKGVESSSNIPPSRVSYTRWKDENNMLYLFGGSTLGSSGSFNDVWRYNINTNQWTWISGSSSASDTGKYPGYCMPLKESAPSMRMENNTVTQNNCTNTFWTFGGFTGFGGGDFNDLWIFNAVNQEWTWVSGSKTDAQLGNFGTKGIYSPTNMIPSRGGVAIWSDFNNNLWIFGGFMRYGTGTMFSNDLWKYEPDTSCFHAFLSSNFTIPKPNDTVICVGEKTTINLQKLSSITISPFDNVTFNIDTTQITFSPTVTTTYKIVGASNGLCGGVDSITFTIVVMPSPVAYFEIQPKDIEKGEPFTLHNLSSNALKYEWYNDGSIFSTNTHTSISFTEPGNYCFTLVAFNSEQCADTFTSCGNLYLGTTVFIPNSFTPNGDSKNDVIKAIHSNLKECDFKVFNRWGENVFFTSDPNIGWDGTYKGRLSESGSYYYFFKYKTSAGKEKILKGDITILR